MTLEQAFYKQKDELHALQRENRKLKKHLDEALEANSKDLASNKDYQKLLSEA